GGSTAKPGWGWFPPTTTADDESLGATRALLRRACPPSGGCRGVALRNQNQPRARSRSRPPRPARAPGGPPSVASLRGDKGGGWFPPTMTSSTGSARVAGLSHELAAARAPLGGPERPPVPPNSLRSRGDKT